MANRYWVGGTGTWNSTNTTNWSTTSGGAGGASAPTGSDMVYFDANSGAARDTISVSEMVFAYGIDFTGSVIQFNASYNYIFLGISGGGNGGINTGTGAKFISSIRLSAFTNTTINCNFSNPTGIEYVRVFNNAKTWNCTGTVIYCSMDTFSGTFNTNNLPWGSIAADVNTFSDRGANIYASGATLNLGTSTVYVNAGDIRNCTINGTSTLYWIQGSGFSQEFQANTLYNFTIRAGSDKTMTVTTVSNNFSILECGIKGVRPKLKLMGNITVNGTFSCVSNPSKRLIFIGDGYTLTANNRGTISETVFNTLVVSGTSLSGTQLGDFGGNTNITFPTGITKYAVGITGTKYYTDSVWSTSSGGAANTTPPLPQDNVILNSSSGSGTLNMGAVDFANGGYLALGSLVTSGYTGNFYMPHDVLYMGGNLDCRNSNVEISNVQLYWSSHKGNSTFSIATGNDRTALPVPSYYGHNFYNLHLGWWSSSYNSAITFNILNNVRVYALTTDNVPSSVTINLYGHLQSQYCQQSFYANTTINGATAGARIGASDLFGSTLDFSLVTVTNKPSILAPVNGTLNLGSNKSWGKLHIANLVEDAGSGATILSNNNTFTDIQSYLYWPLTIKFTGGTTNTFNKWSMKPNSTAKLTMTSTDTSQYNFIYDGIPVISSDNMIISYSNVTPSTLTWYAGSSSTNGGNNTGWIFTDPPGSGNSLFFGSNF